MAIFKEQEISKNVAKTQDNTTLEHSRLTEIVHLVNQDLKQTADTAIANNFTNIFDNFVREETKLPGIRPVEASEPSGISGNSQFLSTIMSAPVNQESPVCGDAKEVLTKDLDASKQIIKMKVPERVDFGEKITINWSHTGTPHPCDWVAMYAEGKATSDSDYYNWQWVPVVTNSVLTPIVFDAPYSAASNFYFKYFSNRSYVCCAESEVVKVGPIFNIQVEKCVETKNQSNLFSATLRVTQEGGKECSHLWIALYANGVQNLKNFLTYQYCSVGKDIVMSIPKSGAWTFKLFPFKSYEPICSLPYFIDGEDKIQLQLVGNQFIISYHIKTMSLDQRPWMGIYEVPDKTGLWKRYKYAQNFEGATTIEVGNLPSGQYEARLLDYDTSNVFAKSEIVIV
jgi:hypothetical protein